MLIGRGFTYTILQAQTKGPLPPSYTKIGAGFLPSAKVSLFGNQLDLLCIVIALAASILIILSSFRANNTKRKYGFPIIPEWQELIKIGLILFLVWFLLIKLALYKGIPYVLLLMGVLVAFYHFLTEKTVAGRQIYALGGNAKAARLSGINTRKVYFWVYANMGLLCGVAGIVLSARNASATPKAGDGFEMDAISACYIGGAAIAGGSGTIIGAVVGALIMGILNNGMSLVGLSTDIQKIVKGMVLLGAVTVDLVSKQKKS
jgi:putative multiple sugar transport system permease protein